MTAHAVTLPALRADGIGALSAPPRGLRVLRLPAGAAGRMDDCALMRLAHGVDRFVAVELPGIRRLTDASIAELVRLLSSVFGLLSCVFCLLHAVTSVFCTP